ncbi:hypothetical protein [Pectobacterium polaris]|nr:hypothetical protein [Pectobacterium polaris]MDG0803549.1 hypothetical protein [Pectobacterium polaris]
MIDLKAIIEKESVSDVVSFFAGSTKGISYPRLDNFFFVIGLMLLVMGDY